MERLSTTPFGARPVSAALLATAHSVAREPAQPHADKWTIFRDLCTGRAAFGVTDRDLTVLNALLSFHRGGTLSDNQVTVVFPSNAALSERAHGMAESTLRRHLAALSRAGLILRHDSPNGKRYARKNSSGDVIVAFGFDLRPLLMKAQEIASAAQAAREATEREKMQRERIALALRDAGKLVAYADQNSGSVVCAEIDQLSQDIAALRARLRRRLDGHEIEAILVTAASLADAAMRVVQPLAASDSEKMSGNAAESEWLHQNQNTEESCFDASKNKGADGVGSQRTQRQPRHNHIPKTEVTVRDAPFTLVRDACRELAIYNGGRLNCWQDVIRAAHFVRGLMGVSPSAWAEAIDIMGEVTASLALGCMLERSAEIRNPGGYLRALSAKATIGLFSPIGMLMSLLNESRDAVRQKVDSCQHASGG